MRTLSILIGLAALPLMAADVVTCPTATLDVYLGMTGGCSIGDKLFTNFTAQFSQFQTASADEITVTPITLPNIAIQFSNNWSSTTDGAADSLITFAVSTLDGNPTIEGLGVAATIQHTGAPLASAGVTQYGDAGSAPYLMHAPPETIPLVPDEIHGLSVSSVTVNDDIFTARLPTDTGTVLSVQNTFFQSGGGQGGGGNAVPEPASVLLVGAGLVFAGWRRVRHSA